MYKTTFTLAVFQALYDHCQAAGMDQLDAAEAMDIIIKGTVMGDVNIYHTEGNGDGGCCCDNHDHDPTADNGDPDEPITIPDDNGNDDNGGDDLIDYCDYVVHAPQNNFKDLAATLDWDMHGFVTDWNWLEPQDVRIDSEFIVYIYQNICCVHLNESIDMMLSRGGFYDYELTDYQFANVVDITQDVLDAQEEAKDRCKSRGQGWVDWDERRQSDPSHYVDPCDHWTDAWFDNKSPQQELAEELNWDTTGFITDYNALNSQDSRIDEEFMIYIYGAACCRELNESIAMMLTSNGFYFDELMDYMQTHVPDLGPRVVQAGSDALARCDAAGQGWLVYDEQLRQEQEFAPKDKCAHWAFAWHEQKSDEQELAEKLGWNVVDFLTDFYAQDAGQDPDIDDNFIIYIYETACCQELQETRNRLLDSHATVQELRQAEENLYELDVFSASEIAYSNCGI